MVLTPQFTLPAGRAVAFLGAWMGGHGDNDVTCSVGDDVFLACAMDGRIWTVEGGGKDSKINAHQFSNSLMLSCLRRIKK